VKKIRTNIITPISVDKCLLKKNVIISFDKRIIDITDDNDKENSLDYSQYVCTPGFIDTHVHLSQFNIRGKHSSNLLHWLETYVFQEEYRSKDEAYARMISRKFFLDAARHGTTTMVIYTAAFKQACEMAFQTASELGYRALIGKTMMDINSPDYLQEDTGRSLEESIELYEKWNDHSDLLNYIFTPRFAPVCSSELMQKTGNFIQKNNAYLQTHLSENKGEIEWVKTLFPEYKSYTDVYLKHGLLSPKTLLGHSIHLEDHEIEIIKDTNSKITHCPDSNFFLNSGAFPIEKIKKAGIGFALASDVGAGTTLSMLNVMKMFNYRQDSHVISPQEAFYTATLAGAEILGKDDRIGSIEVGKEADLVFFKIDDIHGKNDTEILSDLVYLGNEIPLRETIIAGKTVYSQLL